MERLMAIIWSGDDYVAGSGHLNRGAAGGEISCATRKETDPPQVELKADSGSGDWSTPAVIVGTITSGGQFCHCWYDGRYVWVTNGTTFIKRSSDYGKAGTWENY
jgi:hypothetical protein